MLNTKEVSDSQALLNPSCCIVSEMWYGFQSSHLSEPAKSRIPHLSETGRAATVLYLWNVTLSSTPQRYSVLYCDFSCLRGRARQQLHFPGSISRRAEYATCQENILGCYFGLAFQVRPVSLTSIPGKEQILLKSISKDIKNEKVIESW